MSSFKRSKIDDANDVSSTSDDDTIHFRHDIVPTRTTIITTPCTASTTINNTRSTAWLHRLPVALLHHAFGYLDCTNWVNLMDTSHRICAETRQSISRMSSYIVNDGRRTGHQTRSEVICILRTLPFAKRLRSVHLHRFRHNVANITNNKILINRLGLCIEEAIKMNVSTLEFINIPDLACTTESAKLILTRCTSLKAIPGSLVLRNLIEPLTESSTSNSSLAPSPALPFTQLEKLNLSYYTASNRDLVQQNMDTWRNTLKTLTVNELDAQTILQDSSWCMSSLQSLDISIPTGPVSHYGLSPDMDTIDGTFFIASLCNLSAVRFPVLRKLSIGTMTGNTTQTPYNTKTTQPLVPVSKDIAPYINELCIRINCVDWIPYFNLVNLRSLSVRILTVSTLETILQQSPNLIHLTSENIVDDKSDISFWSRSTSTVVAASPLTEFTTFSKPSPRLSKIVQSLAPTLQVLQIGFTPPIQSIVETFANLRELYNSAAESDEDDGYEADEADNNNSNNNCKSQSTVYSLPNMTSLQLHRGFSSTDLSRLSIPNVIKLVLYSRREADQYDDNDEDRQTPAQAMHETQRQWVNMFRSCQHQLQTLSLQLPFKIIKASHMNGIELISLQTLQLELYDSNTTTLFLKACPSLTDVEFTSGRDTTWQCCLIAVMSTLPTTCRFIEIQEMSIRLSPMLNDEIVHMIYRLTSLESVSGLIEDDVIPILLNHPMLKDIHSPYLDDLRYVSSSKKS